MAAIRRFRAEDKLRYISNYQPKQFVVIMPLAAYQNFYLKTQHPLKWNKIAKLLNASKIRRNFGPKWILAQTHISYCQPQLGAIIVIIIRHDYDRILIFSAIAVLIDNAYFM